MKTVHSHLIPRAFANDARAESKRLLVGTNGIPGKKFSQGGIFDDDLLCELHETQLGPLDNFGVDFCRNLASRSVSVGRNLFRIDALDSDKLVRFVVSVIWRFGASEQTLAPEVRLGPYLEKFKGIVFDNMPINPKPEVHFLKYSIRGLDMKSLFSSPSPIFLAKRRGWAFIVYGLRFTVLTDRQTLSRDDLVGIVNGKSSYHYVEKEMEGSSIFDSLAGTVRSMGLPLAKRNR